MEIHGQEWVPRGPLVVAANHESAVDPFVLSSAVPRLLHYMTKEELWRYRPFAWGLDHVGAFPVGRGRGDRDALERGLRLVERGEALAIFPQGAVRTSGPWHRGAAKLALAAGAPLLPVGLVDTDRAIAGSRVGFPRVRVVIGRPIHVERQQPTIAAAKQLTERLRATIEALTQYDAAVS